VIPRLPKGFSHPMTIGEGSFSSVYRVRQQTLDRWVAVKILHEKNRLRRAELLDEARNQAQMSIPCIPAVYDAFVSEQQVFIVMEWIKGISLQVLMEDGIPQASDRAALASSIVAALAGLHRSGFAHRDVKPANILVTADGNAFLVDFGFSRKVRGAGQALDGAASGAGMGVVKGTPAYMAPEIWQDGKDIDYRKADLFALGKVLSELAPGPEWDAAAKPLLSPDPADRPPSASEFQDACRAFSAPRLTPEWKPALQRLSSGLLSRQLLHAAKQLLFARRGAEAYWLLAECLQEDPDCVEALQLIERIPALTKERRRNRFLVGAASILALGLALSAAFHFGMRAAGDGRFPVVLADEESKALLLPPAAAGRKAAKAGRVGKAAGAFMELGGTQSRISGLIFLDGGGRCDSVYLDDLPVPEPAFAGGLSAAPGEHTLVCVEPGAGARHRERISLLPFQRKLLRLGAREPKRET
jgi:predicted Ser/Thr protein kinase